MVIFFTDCPLQVQVIQEQMKIMDLYLQQECRRAVQSQLTSKIGELKQSQQLLATEKTQAERETQEAREARDEMEGTLETRQREIEEIGQENQSLKLDNQQQQQQQLSLCRDIQNLQERLLVAQNQSARQIRDLQLRLDTALAELQKHSQPSPQTVDITPWTVSRNDVRMSKELGRGGWGVVVRGTFKREAVAVKLPHKDLLNQRLLDRLKRETRLMIQVQHPNLVRIIAAVFDEAADQLRRPPLIITELLDINLRQCYLEKRLQPTSRIPVFLDVAYGLHYLHDRQEPIIHRDVSAPNVLLKAFPNGMWRAKVSDFGSANLARLSVTAGDGAIIYTPPEAFPQMDPNTPPTPHTTKIDVYSFGILMSEVVTAEQPDPEVYRERLEKVRRLSRPLHALIVSCTDRSPDKRPTMAAVIDSLNKIPPH